MRSLKTNHSNYFFVILTITKLLHNKMMTARFRQTMQITVDDIFGDFNDPRRDVLSKRVVVAM